MRHIITITKYCIMRGHTSKALHEAHNQLSWYMLEQASLGKDTLAISEQAALIWRKIKQAERLKYMLKGRRTKLAA